MGQGLSEDERTDILTVSTQITSAISLFADVCIIYGYFRFKELKKLAFTFVFYIACADVCRSCAQTWGGVESVACAIQGWLQTLGGVAMFLWFATIASICLSIKKVPEWWKRRRASDIKKLHRILLITITVIAIVCASVPWDFYVDTGGWCWVSSDVPHLRYACYYGWLLACLFFIIFAYIELFRLIRKEEKVIRDEEKQSADFSGDNDKMQKSMSVSSREASSNGSTLNTRKKQKKMFDQMKYYPLALLLGQGPGSIRRFMELLGFEDDIPFALVEAHAICSGLFGFITAVIYGTKTWQLYQKEMRKVCGKESDGDGDGGNGGDTRSDICSPDSRTETIPVSGDDDQL